MGYTDAAERDGKKIYIITEEGLKFLDERKDSADEVRSQMKHKWSFKTSKMADFLLSGIKKYKITNNLPTNLGN